MNSMTYVVYAPEVDSCILIDCGEFETLQPVLERIRKSVEAVFLTHGHLDHIGGLNDLLQRYPNAKIYTNEYGHIELGNSRKNHSFYINRPFEISNYHKEFVSDGDRKVFDGLCEVESFWTHGHDESSFSYRIGNNLFTGDAYIPGIKVFCSFPRGDRKKATLSHERLVEMEKCGCKVLCGHHSYEEMTTIK